MKKCSLGFVAVWLIFGNLLFAQQYTTNSWGDSCGPNESCFTTEILKAERISETCTSYEFKISYEDKCRHGLSHYTVAIPCGQIKNLSNSQNWKQVLGKDPRSGLTGFKIDDIPDFGKTWLKSFTVRFILCTDDEDCQDILKCWEPIVAYKASTNVFYDTLQTSCPALEATIQKTDATCFGASDGSVSVTVTEGEEPFTYQWSTGATTSSISNVPAGNYSVTVSDATGETVDLSAVVNQPGAIAVSGEVVNPSCSGNSDGKITLAVSGGSEGYSYVWSTGATSKDLTGLIAGTYSVTVKDSTGCSTQKAFTLTNGNQILVSATSVLPTCSQSNGSINITITGGTAPYTYTWSNGATTEDITNAPAGSYKVTVKDGLGCTTEFSYILRENNTLRLNAVVAQANCLNEPTGSIDLIVTGGTAPYTYIWSNGATTEDLSGLVSGLYKVTVTDQNGCSATLQMNVSKKSLVAGQQIVQPLCNGDKTGSITLNPSGGTAPYTINWSTGSTSNSITDLASGVYTVTITDAAGCTNQFTYVIQNPAAIIANASVSNNQCNTEGNYAIDLTVTGGKSPYTYVWSNGEITQDIDSLNSGTYTVIIKDSNGCTIAKSVTVSGQSAGWSCLITPPDSIPACTSTGNLLNTGVVGTTYQWSVQSSDNLWTITNGASTSSIAYTAGSENSSATFTLTITKDGCSQTCSYTVATCITDSTGGENPDPGNPGNGSCEDCFDSSIEVVNTDGSCKTYEVIVSTDGTCRHDLSHWTIAIPCGTVSNSWNSEGWKLEFGKDPTTGLYGLKVDDINDFGGEPGTFKVRFTLCAEDECKDKLSNWKPVVAYKAGQCVADDTLSLDDDDDFEVCGYPNPFHGDIRFEWKCKNDDYVQIDIIDKCGREMKKVYKGHVRKGETYRVDCDGSEWKDDMYFYRFSSSKRTTYGKLLKTR
ncbi:MAG TPA: SprB repeat-containing protein [Ohtaekwangia sp.]